MEKENMRNLQLESAIWYLFTSTEFFEAAAKECDETMNWFGTIAISRKAVNFGRNNQIFDTFKGMARDFRRGAEQARFGDYQLISEVAGCVSGDIRGMMEQPLHSWMTEAEFQEFSGVRISRLLAYATQIKTSLNNGLIGAEAFFNPNPDHPERSNDDNGFPGERILEIYSGYVEWYKEPRFWALPDPLPKYIIDKSIKCITGAEVPWTGVWYPSTELERHSLTFAIKGMRMPPAYRVIKTTEELRTDEYMFPPPETIAVTTTWHPIITSNPQPEVNQELWAKAGQPCPKTGIWQPTDPGAAPRAYMVGEPMGDLKSAFGFTVWRWVADR